MRLITREGVGVEEGCGLRRTEMKSFFVCLFVLYFFLFYEEAMLCEEIFLMKTNVR